MIRGPSVGADVKEGSNSNVMSKNGGGGTAAATIKNKFRTK